MTHPDRHLLDGHVRDWNDPRPAGLYLTLHHGRADPEQEMEDFGFDGPIIGPFKWCHITYSSTFNFGWADGDETSGPHDAITVVKRDLVSFDGKYYGDWEFQLLEAKE